MNEVENLVEVKLPTDDTFLKVKETLTRIGVASKKDKKLYQSCHILHKRGKYYITHFKELFILDGKENTFDDTDKGRRNAIVNLLEQWNLVECVNPTQIEDPVASLNQIKVLSYKEKGDWELVPKYNIGTKR